MRRTLSPLRRGRITASRLPALLGVSPFLTRKQLLRVMVREHFGDPDEFVGNIATEWGIAHEDDALAEYEMSRGVVAGDTGDDQQTLVHPHLDFLAATPDGVLGDRVVEVKAPWRSLYTSIEDRPDYFAQVQVQMTVTGLPLADLVVWRPGHRLVVDTIRRDPGWMEAQLPLIHEFLDELRTVVADPEQSAPHREPLRDTRDDPEWAEAAAEWLELDFLVRRITEARDAAAGRLAALSPTKPARGAGIDLLRYERRGNVQYAQAIKDLGVTADLDRYRAKPSTVTTVRRVGEPSSRTGGST